MNANKVFIRSFGCQMNEADSEVMGRFLERGGVADFTLRVIRMSGCHNS